MEIQLLKDREVFPATEVLKQELGNSLSDVYSALIRTITQDLSAEYEWRYYNDGKAWLCKLTFKKKTLCWLSAWEGCIKTGFYFSEKYSDEILQLPIKSEIIENFKQSKPVGKLRSVVIELKDSSNLVDFFTIAEFKKKTK